MNDIDRSVESFDFALRRRFRWIEIKTTDVMEDVLEKLLEHEKAFDLIMEKIKKLNEYIASSEENGMGLSDAYCIGPAYFKSFKDMSGKYKTKILTIYKNEIEMTLKEYVRGRDQNSINAFIDDCRNCFGISVNKKGENSLEDNSKNGKEQESAPEPVPAEVN